MLESAVRSRRLALERVLGRPLKMEFTPQPALHGSLRGEAVWSGAPGTASRIASELRTFPGLRFEVTEDASPATTGNATRAHLTSEYSAPRLPATATSWWARSNCGPCWPALPQLASSGSPSTWRSNSRPDGPTVGRRTGTVPSRRRRRPGAVAQPSRLSSAAALGVAGICGRRIPQPIALNCR